jgi:hypothetical protein
MWKWLIEAAKWRENGVMASNGSSKNENSMAASAG